MNSSHFEAWERRIQIALAAMVILAAMMLGISHYNSRLSILTIVAAGASVYYTDIRKTFRLNRWLANILALGCVAYSFWSFANRAQEYRLLSIVEPIVYLQLVLFFQEKSERVQLQIALLSLLEIVVCCALTTDLYFGVGMVLYAVVGLWFLWLVQGRRQMRLADGSLIKAQSAGFHGFAPIENDAHSADRTPRLPWQTWLGWSVSAVLLSAVLFLLLPRTGRGTTVGQAVTNITGFSETVKLGQLGETIQSSDLVLRVSFFDPATNAPLSVSEGILLRGSVLTTYENRTWHREEFALRHLDLLPSAVRQRIELLPTSENVIFSVFPPVAAADSERFDIHDGLRVTRKVAGKPTRTVHSLGTLGITKQGQIREIVPSLEVEPGERLSRFPTPDQGSFTQLTRSTDQVLATAGVSAQDQPIRAAAALVRYLRDSGEFRYSLQGQQRNLELDPIEDFISVHRVGHCEYYASALCLMLRHAGIPARVAVGYRAEYNPLAGDFFARQLDAHAWVEAYLSPKFAPDGIDADLPSDLQGRGAWMILDPTPASGEGTSASSGPFKWWRDMTDYVDRLWGRYVIALDGAQQEELIYAPLRTAWETVLESVTSSLDWLREWLRQIPASLIWAIPLAVALMFGLVQFRPAFWRRLRFRFGGIAKAARPATRRAAPVEFYRRWEELCRRAGLLRRPVETPREFVQSGAFRHAHNGDGIRVCELANRVIDAFYRVRFGRHALDNSEVQEVEQALRELETLLDRSQQST